MDKSPFKSSSMQVCTSDAASRWNPKMAPFIHGRRNLIHIIDLRETLRGVLRAENLLYHLAAEGSTILWVGTKRQVKGVIQEAGQRTGTPSSPRGGSAGP
jgi:small subunit ribosomal protein S2